MHQPCPTQIVAPIIGLCRRMLEKMDPGEGDTLPWPFNLYRSSLPQPPFYYHGTVTLDA